jgi:hypothetical protein
VTFDRQRPSRSASVDPHDEQLEECTILLVEVQGMVGSWGDHYSVATWMDGDTLGAVEARAIIAMQ